MKTCNRVLQSACFVLALLLGLSNASSQGRVAAYTVTNFSGGFNSIINTGNVWYMYDTWNGSYGISIPFAFNYDNQSISQGSVIYATAQGAIALSSRLPPAYTSTAQGSQSYPSLLNFLQATMVTGYRHWSNS